MTDAQSFLGAGDLYMDRLDEDGTKNGLVKVGAALLSLQSNAEIRQATSKGRDAYGQVLASATIGQPPVVNASITQLDRVALAMNFLGNLEDVDVSAGAETAEEVTVQNLDRYFRLAKRNIEATSVVVTRSAGSAATAWSSEAVVAEGDYYVPPSGSENDHFYKVTTGGTVGTTEPTWPTDGSTVEDGTAVFQDMGLIEAAATDFEVIARTGMIRALSTGNIEAEEVLSIAYDYLDVSGAKVLGAVQPTIKAYLFLDGINKVDGKDVEVEVWEAQLRPTSPVDFLADDFTSLEMEGTPVTPTDKDSPFVITYID